MCWCWLSFVAGIGVYLILSFVVLAICVRMAPLVDDYGNPIVKVQNERSQ